MFNFTEADFLPVGTHPGVVGGTPEGKRAITLDAGKIKGVHDLKEGDHVDLLSSTPVDMPGAGRSNSGRTGTSVVATPDMALLPKGSIVKALVQDGVVVTPVQIRGVPIGSMSPTQATATRAKPVEEIVLAVDPQEVAPLAAAMDLKYEITCVARSGRPASVQPAASPKPAGPHQRRAGPPRLLPRWPRSFLAAAARPFPKRLRRRLEKPKPSTQRRVRHPPKTGWPWTSRPDWTRWPRPVTWR